MHIPCRRPSHVACPPRLKPARTHSPMVRSSFGNTYAGRTSMRNETSFTAPTVNNKHKSESSVLLARQSTALFFTHLVCHTCRRCVYNQSQQIHFTINNRWPPPSRPRPGTRACRSLCSSLLRPHPKFPHSSTVLSPWFRWSCPARDPVIINSADRLQRQRESSSSPRSEEKPRTNVTTMKSRGLCRFVLEVACFSAAHANAARAVGSMLSADCPLPCKKNSTTMDSEECLSRRSDRAYTCVRRPATFSVSFTTSTSASIGIDGVSEGTMMTSATQKKTTAHPTIYSARSQPTLNRALAATPDRPLACVTETIWTAAQ